MKAFVISLSRIQDSAISSKRVLDNLLHYGFDAKLFEGTYGWDAKSLFEQEKRIISQDSIKSNLTEEQVEEWKKRSQKFLRPGVLGCFYSHYRLWQKCIELNESIFIFEDDVIFYRNFIPVEWEEVLLLCTGKVAHTHWYYSTFLINPQGIPEAVEMRNTSMPGAVGYAIKPIAAKKLIEKYKIEMLPADTAINQHVVKIECHNYLMGRATLAEDGKVSLTASKFWDNK